MSTLAPYKDVVVYGVPMWYCEMHRFYFPKHLACPVCSPMVMSLIQDDVRLEVQKSIAADQAKKEN